MLFTEIPEEVIFDHILPFLEMNDLLRLRRVCKTIKPLAEDYLRLHVFTDRIIEINLKNEEEENLSSFLSLSLQVPVSRLRILNKNNKSWENEQLLELLELYGDKITHLAVTSMEIPMVSRKAVKFFESLPNLEHLAVGDVHERGHLSKSRRKKRRTAPETSPPQDLLIPSTFKRLRSLRIYRYNCSPNAQSAQLIWKLIEECSVHLEFLHHPEMELEAINLEELPGRGIFGTARGILGGPNPLKYYDMRDFSATDVEIGMVEDFYQLVTACSRNNVKLLNVDAYLIDEMMTLDTWDMEDHGRKLSSVVSSLHFLHKSSFLLEFPHLEKIVIGEDNGTMQCSMPNWEFQRHSWPNLKYLEIWVDSEMLWEPHQEEDQEETRSSDLLAFFFKRIKREKMETLKMSFYKHYYRQCDILPYPRIKDIYSSCPNLRKLTIGYWPGSNKAISKLWSNLPHLEEVIFENCRSLGNVAFVGANRDKPTFLEAKNLQFLKLDGLDRMEKITDIFFRLVLRHMPLKELHLSSMRPIHSITVSGIKSLLSGVFAETIEKFGMEINLGDMTEEEMTALKNEFRSSRMM